MFGTGILSPIDRSITLYGHDPCALGSYSFNPAGTRRRRAKPWRDRTMTKYRIVNGTYRQNCRRSGLKYDDLGLQWVSGLSFTR